MVGETSVSFLANEFWTAAASGARRHFRNGAAGSIGSDPLGRYHTLEKRRRATLATALQTGPGRFGLRRQSGATTALSIRSGGSDWFGPLPSLPHARKRCRAALATALQNCNGVQVIARKIPWPHAPEHRLCSRGTYFVTASTYLRQHHFAGKTRLAVLHRGLLKLGC